MFYSATELTEELSPVNTESEPEDSECELPSEEEYPGHEVIYFIHDVL